MVSHGADTDVMRFRLDEASAFSEHIKHSFRLNFSKNKCSEICCMHKFLSQIRFRVRLNVLFAGSATRREAKQHRHQRRAVRQQTRPPHPWISCLVHPPDPRRLRPSPVCGGTSSSRSASGTRTPNDAMAPPDLPVCAPRPEWRPRTASRFRWRRRCCIVREDQRREWGGEGAEADSGALAAVSL